MLMRRTILTFLSFAYILAGLFPAVASETASLNLAASDIAAFAEHDKKLFIKLTPPATAKFHEFTRTHIGKSIELAIEGTPMLRATAHSEVLSGVIEVNQPSVALRKKLEAIQSPQNRQQ